MQSKWVVTLRALGGLNGSCGAVGMRGDRAQRPPLLISSLRKILGTRVRPAIAGCGFKTPYPEMEIFPHSVVFAPTPGILGSNKGPAGRSSAGDCRRGKERFPGVQYITKLKRRLGNRNI